MVRYKKLFILFSLLLIIPLISNCEARRQKKEYQKHLSQGEKYYSDSNFEKAIEEFKLATQIDPKSDEAYQNIAVCYSNLFLASSDPLQKTKNVEIANNAIKFYKKVLELKPENSEAKQNISGEYARLANMYMNDGQFPEAMLYLKQRTEEDPKNSEGFYTIGVLDWGICFDNKKLYNLLSIKSFVDSLKSDENAVAEISKKSGLTKELVLQILDAINADDATVLGKLDQKNLLSRLVSIPKTKKEDAEKALQCIAQTSEDIMSCMLKVGVKLDNAKQFRTVLSKTPENVKNYLVLTVKGVSKGSADKAVTAMVGLLKNVAIEDGLKSLDKSIQINANYPDAHNYIVLLYVEKIKLETDRKKQDEFIKTASEHFAKASKLRDPAKPDKVINDEVQSFTKSVDKIRGKKS